MSKGYMPSVINRFIFICAKTDYSAILERWSFRR